MATPPPAPAPLHPTAARYVFLGYAATLSLILYLDRTCIAKSADAIGRELGLNKADLGWVFSAFTLGYLVFEIPSGAWGDRFGPKWVLCRIVVCWSLFTALTGCVVRLSWDRGGFVALFLVRFLFGVGEAGAYPNLAKSTGRWFPLRERGLAQGVIIMAGRLGGGLAAGLTIVITAAIDDYLWPGLGWRVSFWVFGVLGLVWVASFARWFRNSPAEHPGVNAAELALIQGIEDGGSRIEDSGPSGKAAPSAPSSILDPQSSILHPPSSIPPAVPWGRLLRSANLGAFAAMAFCSALAYYLYFTHFPAYLKERRGLPDGWLWVAGVPMITGAAGCVVGGYLTDGLMRRTGSRRWARRAVGLAGKGGGALLLLAGARAEDPAWAVALIGLSAFANDLVVPVFWAVCTDTGGRFVATVFAVVNSAAAVGGIVSPVLAGYLLEGVSPTGVGGGFDPVARAHAWDAVLYLFAAVLAGSAVCWLRIDADEPIAE